jgi:hypothetical protein
MSWLFSQALVAEYSAANSSAGAPSVLSSASPTPQAYSSPDRMTAFSRLSRFGMMFAPLTDDHGEAVLTWFLAGFLAKTSAQPEREQALTELEADCGKKWRGLLVKWYQDMFSSKTVLCSEQEDSTLFSKTLPKWGMMLDGECSEQSMPVLRTSETGSGLWRTPMARDWKDMSCSSQIYLQDQVKMWPTPCATDHKGSGKTGTLRDRLDYAAERGATKSNTYATPQARDFRSGSTDRWDNPERTRNLNDQIGGQLNPTWVEWLMGWPLGWTDLKPLETDKFQQWLLQHGKY